MRPLSHLFLVFLCLPIIFSQPSVWEGSVLSGDSLYGGRESEGGVVLPGIGNGYTATQVMGERAYVAGVYTGAATSPSHRAGIPSPLRVRVSQGETRHARLHVLEGVYERRSVVTGRCEAGEGGGGVGVRRSCVHSAAAGGVLEVEQRWYAHRVLRHLLVHEVEVVGDATRTLPPRPVPPPPTNHTPAASAPSLVCPSSLTHPGGTWGGTLGSLTLQVSPTRCYHTHATLAAAAAAAVGVAEGRTARKGHILGHIVLENDTPSPSEDMDATPLTPQDCAAAGVWAKGAFPAGALGVAGELDRVLEGCGTLWQATLYTAKASELEGGERPQVVALSPLFTSLNSPEEGDTSGPPPPPYLSLPVTHATLGSTLPLITAMVSSLDFPDLSFPSSSSPPLPFSPVATRYALLAAAASQYALGNALAEDGLLFALHATAWRNGIWSSGIEVGETGGGREREREFRGVGEGVEKGDKGGRSSSNNSSSTTTTLGSLGTLTNSSLYSLVSILRADWPFGLGPGGLSSSGYGGRSFWDTESFSWQPLNLLFPELGAALLEYRLHRLPGARAKAASYTPPYGGYPSASAMIPWESAFSGVEACPSGYPTGDKEIHVSGDVAVAVAQRFTTSGGDLEWLGRVGWPLLRGIAEFWTRRAVSDTPGAVIAGVGEGGGGEGGGGVVGMGGRRLGEVAAEEEGGEGESSAGESSSGSSGSGINPCDEDPYNCPLHIKGVIAPTEFYGCDDNTYTNGVAQLALLAGAAAADTLLKGQPPRLLKQGQAQAQVPPLPLRNLHGNESAIPDPYARPSTWRATAERLVIPFDAARQAHPYFGGYTWGAPVQLLDVPLLSLVLGFPMDRGVLRNNIRAYSGAFEGGAAFSYAVNALAAVEVGDWGGAHGWVGKALDNFVAPPYGVWSEYPGGRGCPNFVTGAAGWVQALVFGYVHVRVGGLGGGEGGGERGEDHPGKLTLRPVLPLGISSLVVRGVAFGGHRLRIAVSSKGTTVTLEEEEEEGEGEGEGEGKGGEKGEGVNKGGKKNHHQPPPYPRAYPRRKGQCVIDTKGGTLPPPFRCPSGSEEWEAALLDIAHTQSGVVGGGGGGGKVGGGFTPAKAPRRGLGGGGASSSTTLAATSAPPINPFAPRGAATATLKALASLGSNAGGGGSGGGGKAPHHPPSHPVFDPDDPKSTPQDMIRARPWLSTPLGGPFNTRYSTSGSGGGDGHGKGGKEEGKVTCIVVREEGGKKQTVLRKGGWVHTATSEAEGQQGLNHPQDVDTLPVILISVESGLCGDFVGVGKK